MEIKKLKGLINNMPILHENIFLPVENRFFLENRNQWESIIGHMYYEKILKFIDLTKKIRSFHDVVHRLQFKNAIRYKKSFEKLIGESNTYILLSGMTDGGLTDLVMFNPKTDKIEFIEVKRHYYKKGKWGRDVLSGNQISIFDDVYSYGASLRVCHVYTSKKKRLKFDFEFKEYKK